MKIEKLTKEQEDLIPIVRDEWIQFCLGGDTSIDKEKTTEGINWIYSLSKLNAPKFIAFADGPLAAQFIANIFPSVCKEIPIELDKTSVRNSVRDSVWNSVRDSVWNSVGNSVWNSVENSVVNSVEKSVWNSVEKSVVNSVWDSVRNSVENSVEKSVVNSVVNSIRKSVENSVWNSVVNSVWNSVWNSVENSVENSVVNSVWNSVENSVWNSKLKWEYPYNGLGGWAGWFAFYDFFEKCGITTKEFVHLKEWVKSGLWEILWFQDLCIVVCRPSVVNKNSKGQLHCTSGPSAKWPSGEEYWFLNGINVNEKIVLHPEKLTKEEILGEKNVDVRREMLRQIGMERFCKLTNPKVLDKQGDYELLSIDLSDSLKDCHFLKMRNASINVIHIEGVERECSTVEDALAWRAGSLIKKGEKWEPIELT